MRKCIISMSIIALLLSFIGCGLNNNQKTEYVTSTQKSVTRNLMISFTPDYSGYGGKYMIIKGWVKNTGNEPYSFVKIKASAIRKSDGSVLNSTWMYAIDSLPLDPGERRVFTIMIEDPHANPDNRIYDVKIIN